MSTNRHAVHHTYTQIQGIDPGDGAAEPNNVLVLYEQLLVTVVDDLSGRDRRACVRANASANFLVCAEAGSPANLRRGTPDARGVRHSRGAGRILGRFAPLIYWIIPRILGEPLQRAWRIAPKHQRVAMKMPDVRTNTRSTETGAVMRTLCWNVPYHSEHHVCSQVPFFALPKLNRLVGHEFEPDG